MGIILDSSVLLTWLVSPDKEKSEHCRKLIGGYIDELYSHDLLNYEVSNALVFTTRKQELIGEAYSVYELLPISFLKLNSTEYKLAREISIAVRDSVYDASYHALAITKSMEFVTCDRKYYKKAKHLGFIRLID